MIKKIELLAPAKNLEIGLSAINCGADAVYIGAQHFGAREKASNSIKDIEKLCEYAHKYWVKVYAVINTILYDHELPVAHKLIWELNDIGIDAIIIQDVGLLELDLPKIPVFASTQMNNCTIEKILFLEKIGFKRVILARELSLDEINNISKKSSIDLEFFIHGSLCVSYSGRCYMSYYNGGRSANRGKCAQPCRKPYDLLDGSKKTKKYFLSLKDLNLSEHIEKLIHAGISSFKIEGRMKDVDYVVNVVSFYRKKLDEILESNKIKKSSSGNIYIDFIPDLYKSFNRGYTNYFLFERKESIASLDTPKSIGEKTGKVIKKGKDFFSLDNPLEFSAGDGICFFDQNKNLTGTIINRFKDNNIYPDKMNGIEIGSLIYRNHNHSFIKEIRKSSIKRKIKLNFIFSEIECGFYLKAEDEDENIADFSINQIKIIAENKELAYSNIYNQLNKLGNTCFYCYDLKIEIKNPYFIPINILNKVRRGVIEELISIRIKNIHRDYSEILINDIAYPDKKLSSDNNIVNNKAKAFYKRHGVSVIEPSFESGLKIANPKKLMTSKYCIFYEIGRCKKSNKDNIDLYLMDENKNKYQIKTDCSLCEMELWEVR